MYYIFFAIKQKENKEISKEFLEYFSTNYLAQCCKPKIQYVFLGIAFFGLTYLF